MKLSKGLHVSWLITWLSAGLLAGIILAFWFHNQWMTGWQSLALAGVLAAIAFYKKIYGMILLTLLAGLLVGLWRGSNLRLETNGYQTLIGQKVQLTGVIADDVTHKNGQTGVKLKNIEISNQKLGGEMWAGVLTSADLKRGDQLVLSGKLKPGFGTFTASLSYADLVRFSRPANGDISREVRDKFTAGLKKAVPEPAAGLGIGYLTGQHNNLPATLTKQMQNIGLIHLVIAGGYNVTILIRLMRRGLNKISKYLAVLSSGLVLSGLTFMAGFSAPMARTAVVTGLSLAAWYYGRKIHPLILLPVAAALTALVDPTFLWGDIGWYMTFVAYGGLIMLAPALKKIVWKGMDAGLLKQILADTIAVQIVTFPLMAFAFGQYSIYGLPANLLVLPFMPLTMFAAAIAGLGGMFLPFGGARIIGWPANILLNYTDKITVWLANAPGAAAGATFSVSILVLSYAAVIFGGFWLLRKSNFKLAAENVIE